MSDIIERLKKWVVYKNGDVPAHAHMTNWGEALRADLTDAIAEIEFLRTNAGAVSRGESHADLKRRQGPQPTEWLPNPPQE